MGRLIDTSIFIESEKGRLDLDANIEQRRGEDFFMSVITASELLHGIHRASANYRDSRMVTIERWISRFSLIDIDLPIAREHAKIHSDLRSKGQNIGAHDLWLAATCIDRGLKIVTANVKEFGRIEDLQVENWLNDQ